MIEHKHLIIRAEVTKPPKATDFIVSWMTQLVKDLDMEMFIFPSAGYVEDEGNKGLTAVCIIKTSNLAFHCWDECSPAIIQLDVYSCKAFEVKTVTDALAQFEPTKIEMKLLDREHGLTEIEI